MSNAKPKRILFQLSGSIACYKSCFVLSRLVQLGFEVEVVATQAALQFVGEATLEGLTGKRVHIETFASGQYMKHIHLVRWADLVVLAPASANTINKLAAGVADDLVSTLFLAHDFKKPYLIAPAMNSEMLAHPATQSSLNKLSDWGVTILSSGNGNLACGEIGGGRLLEPDELIEQIHRHLETSAVDGRSFSGQSSDDSTSLSILVTSGGTREPLDGVRYITNLSTGRTGAYLAQALADRGHQVTLLHAASAALPEPHLNIRLKNFSSFADLAECLESELKTSSYDAILHAAAVSDFSVDTIETDGQRMDRSKKLASESELTLKLKLNPKLIDQVRSWSRNPDIRVLAFKLTNTTDTHEQLLAVEKLAKRAQPDWIVHNELSEIDSKLSKGQRNQNAHPFTIYDGTFRISTPVAKAAAKRDLVNILEHFLATENRIKEPR